MSSTVSPATESPEQRSTLKLRVGEWTVEPERNELSAAGSTVKLEPKTMAVLVYLAHHAGRVVSREAVLSAVWADVVVGDDSVTQVIMKLRKALGRSSYIQTISKAGYRLTAPVAQTDETTLRPAPLTPRSPQIHRNARGLWIAGACIAAVVAAAGAVWSIAPRNVPDRVITGTVDLRRATQATRVAVRPFEALGDDARDALLARGMTADLITDLSKAGFSLIGLPLAGSAARSESDGPRAGYVVSGSIQRLEQHLRLHVRLTDVHTDEELWSERFDRSLSGFFDIQEELGVKIFRALAGKISEAERQRVAQRYTRNLEAYEYFERAQSALRLRQKEENEFAREMYSRAIELDPGFARAYAGLARTYAAEYRHQWAADGGSAIARAFELARTAYEIDPDLPETVWVLAYVHMERREHEQALRYLNIAVRLDASFADAYALMGNVNAHIGRLPEAIRLTRIAMRLNPEATRLYFVALGRAYLFLGDLEQARVNLHQAVSRNPALVEPHVFMAALHVAAGNKAAAAWEAEEIRLLQPGFSSRAWLETYPTTDATQKTQLAHALGELGL